MAPALLEEKINLKQIAHVYYIHKDLDKAHQFLLDFGLSVVKQDENKIFYRGYGTEPFLYCASKGEENAFGGAAFVVESMEDLELAQLMLPNASKIRDLDAPGGGKCVTFHEPVDGCAWHLVFGQTPAEMTETFPELSYNFPTAKHRAVNKTQRFKHGPAPVHKLGHFGFCVTDYKRAFDFYTRYFNFKPSDIIYDDNGNDITTFFHLDRGTEQVDHHSFFFYEGPKFHVHHSSFEVHDFDIQLLGHQWLKDKNYELVWGVGRHVMGSQIFDYWYDTSEFIVEHYVDGDLVDESTPTTRTKAGPGNLHVWGPEVPDTFLL